MRVLFFSHLQEVTGHREWELSVPMAVDTEQLWARLIQQFPMLANYQRNVRLARNWEYTDAGTKFTNTDEVALIPPVSGG